MLRGQVQPLMTTSPAVQQTTTSNAPAVSAAPKQGIAATPLTTAATAANPPTANATPVLLPQQQAETAVPTSTTQSALTTNAARWQATVVTPKTTVPTQETACSDSDAVIQMPLPLVHQPKTFQGH
jgi:hypothetical protein